MGYECRFQRRCTFKGNVFLGSDGRWGGCGCWEFTVDMVELVKIAQAAENNFVGVNCGIGINYFRLGQEGTCSL